tara:strand:- start:286 stop:477 length:192 start_codon:yes stop_codon:yes gene_type:complete
MIKSKKVNSVVDYFIIFGLFFLSLIFQSLKTLFQLFSYGIFKKEILTEKSNLGFDLKIKIKSK